MDVGGSRGTLLALPAADRTGRDRGRARPGGGSSRGARRAERRGRSGPGRRCSRETSSRRSQRATRTSCPTSCTTGTTRWRAPSCAAAIARASRAGGCVVFSFLLSEALDPPQPSLMDLLMMTVEGGRERTLGEMCALLESGGYEFVRDVPLAGPMPWHAHRVQAPMTSPHMTSRSSTDRTSTGRSRAGGWSPG